MSDTINIEQAILENLRSLSHHKQQEVLDFVEFLVQKTANQNQLVNEAVPKLQKRLSLQEIARLPITERHKILEPFIAATAADFLTDPELTEFSVLDGEDWEIESELESVGTGSWVITIQKKAKLPVAARTHDAFLQGYAPEDAGLYDDDPSR